MRTLGPPAAGAGAPPSARPARAYAYPRAATGAGSRVSICQAWQIATARSRIGNGLGELSAAHPHKASGG